MDELTHRSVDEFLDAVAQRTPTPGGGSVAAMAGALACALARMVAAYSIGKDTDKKVRDRTEALLVRLGRADEILRGLVTRDAVTYVAMSAATKTVRENPATKPAYQDALLAAAAVPMETAAAASMSLAAMDELKDFANPRLLSDLGVGAALAEAAARAAWYMVTVNLEEVVDTATRTKLRDGIDEMIRHCEGYRGSIEALIRPRLENLGNGSR